MQFIRRKHFFATLALTFTFLNSWALTERYRCMWRDDPATSMVIGWDQISGSDPILYYDTRNHGRDLNAYRHKKFPDRVNDSHGMRNHFVRLSNLKPGTVYYFIIRDSEGLSRQMSFRTAPAEPGERLSVIAGGDSRNFRDARLNANRLVSKLRPHFVMFGGDFTADDSAEEWGEWFDDWQTTIGSDGRLFPILVTRGNHEYSNSTLEELFDTPNWNIVYAFTFGGDLLRVYTLNSMIPPGGEQSAWLEKDLAKNGHISWTFAQYHQTMRPHTAKKPEKDEQVLHWAPLFQRFGVDLVIESDAHVVKTTWPIRPSTEAGSQEGFIRDDQQGTVYIGEGCWGAPLRPNDDEKSWTRNSGSFNQFKWIFIDREKVEIRTVKTDLASQVGEVSAADVFEPPVGLILWQPSNGDVITMNRRSRSSLRTFGQPLLAARQKLEIHDFKARPASHGYTLEWNTRNETSALVFEVLRSTDGGYQFEPIISRTADGSPSNRYSMADLLPPGTSGVRYRLKCTMPDGKVTYHDCAMPANTALVTIAADPKITPDKITGLLTVRYHLRTMGAVTLQFLNNQQKTVKEVALARQAAGTHSHNVDLRNLPIGEYLLAIQADGKLLQRYRVVKQF